MKKTFKWIGVFSGVIMTVLLLRGFLFTSYIIPFSGMENSLFRGDYIIVNKWSYGLRLPCMSLLSYHRWLDSPLHSGEIVVFNNPAASSQPIIDQRNTFISRCIGTPGDTLLLDSIFSLSSSQEKAGPDRKNLYSYPKEKEHRMDSLLTLLGLGSNKLMGQNEQENVRSFSHYEYYLLEQALQENNWVQPFRAAEKEAPRTLVIPGKGKSIPVEPWNATLFRNTIALHEGVQAEVKNDSLFIAGKPISAYTFTKDYYWMASNNSINLTDSRLFGLVPHDHIIGKASFIWFSKKENTSLFEGFRWSRFFKPVK